MRYIVKFKCSDADKDVTYESANHELAEQFLRGILAEHVHIDTPAPDTWRLVMYEMDGSDKEYHYKMEKLL